MMWIRATVVIDSIEMPVKDTLRDHSISWLLCRGSRMKVRNRFFPFLILIFIALVILLTSAFQPDQEAPNRLYLSLILRCSLPVQGHETLQVCDDWEKRGLVKNYGTMLASVLWENLNRNTIASEVYFPDQG